jgi:hypothetical protein
VRKRIEVFYDSHLTDSNVRLSALFNPLLTAGLIFFISSNNNNNRVKEGVTENINIPGKKLQTHTRRTMCKGRGDREKNTNIWVRNYRRVRRTIQTHEKNNRQATHVFGKVHINRF